MIPYPSSDMLLVWVFLSFFFLVDASGEFTDDYYNFGSSVFKACSIQGDTS